MSSAPTLERFPRPVTNMSVLPTWPKVKGANTARVGLILLDSSLKPIYFNSEALSIFAYPHEVGKSKVSGAEFSELIRSVVRAKPVSDDFPTRTLFVSGRRRYVCRSFVLEPDTQGGTRPTVAVTVERDRWVLRDLVTRFQLTDREMEAVQHLADGLTSKEIAQRMNISPNTVKTFLRLVMIKMGVTTRSGVIGKLINGAHFGE